MIDSTKKFYTKEKAKEISSMLNEDEFYGDEGPWSYIPDYYENGRSVIEVFDENFKFIGYI